MSSTRTRDMGEGVSEIASGSRLLKEDLFSAQAISQLLQATHRSELTKMAFIALPKRLDCIQRPPDVRCGWGRNFVRQLQRADGTLFFVSVVHIDVRCQG